MGEFVVSPVSMRSLLVSLALVSLSLASQLHVKEFEEFKVKHNKVYCCEEEEQKRLEIFSENLREVLEHNIKGASYVKGINEFSDLTSVKNQGQCGSCWAFATTEQVESYYQIATGELVELSAQQVTSCTPNVVQCGGTGGCYGSVTELGFNYLQLFGHMLDSDWPYVSGGTTNSEDCTYDLSSMSPAVGLQGYDTLPPNNQEAVMQHLAEVGPLAIAVDASSWGSYSGGVFDGCSFDENISINHGVQLVGYGSDFSPLGVYDYWLVRNSWGPNWGENGYIKLLRTSKCGTNSTPMDGTACSGGPGNDQQTVCGMCGMYLDSSYPLGVRKF